MRSKLILERRWWRSCLLRLPLNCKRNIRACLNPFAFKYFINAKILSSKSVSLELNDLIYFESGIPFFSVLCKFSHFKQRQRRGLLTLIQCCKWNSMWINHLRVEQTTIFSPILFSPNTLLWPLLRQFYQNVFYLFFLGKPITFVCAPPIYNLPLLFPSNFRWMNYWLKRFFLTHDFDALKSVNQTVHESLSQNYDKLRVNRCEICQEIKGFIGSIVGNLI